ncbi:thermonuclease family protein [Cardiobacterium valvarum]|uniref:Nuclease-like protein n=1 Tax=Cardiobacterium valvarum F0432 TaxID=797473 RepID=G9ZDI4_9GAMM|nr:thermonuclease family protein [Cardiobacterium valvarum]EHM55310.1 nuclease-like protein [Cardiobacterium valvarum F0432]
MKTLILTAALLAAGGAQAYELRGKVVAVTDGDTITLLDADKWQQKIRLADIDAPERRQPWGQRAKEALSQMVAGREVRANCHEPDRYGRHVCTVFVGTTDANAEMVTHGNAWVYERYNIRDDLPRLQEQAQAERRGLWQLPEAERIPPADWRKQRKEKKHDSKQTVPARGDDGNPRHAAPSQTNGEERDTGGGKSGQENR